VKIIIYAGIEFDLWNKYHSQNDNITIVNKILKLEEYYEIIRNSFLIYSPLRKSNNDLQTSRSVEIPYFGGVLFTERTSEHLKMYKENEEAIFFDSMNELLEKYIQLKNMPELYNMIKVQGYYKAKLHNQNTYISLINQHYAN
jgi:hypothetical protein